MMVQGVHVQYIQYRLTLLPFFRLAGSYEALEAGNTGDALVDFTGGVCESINLKDGGYSQDTDKRQALFKSMERATRDKSLISASIRVSFPLCDLRCSEVCSGIQGSK